MAIVKVASVKQDGSGTSSAIDTTGATLLVLVCSWYGSVGGAGTPSDSKGNTWTQAVTSADAGGVGVTIYYAVSPTVGSGHTFTQTIGANIGSFAVIAYSGTATASPLDATNGNAKSGSSSTLSCGSVTPAADGYVVVTVGVTNGTGGAVVSVDAGQTIDQNMSSTFYSALAFEIQTTATTRNPTYTFTAASDYGATAIASFKAAGGGGGGGVILNWAGGIGFPMTGGIRG